MRSAEINDPLPASLCWGILSMMIPKLKMKSLKWALKYSISIAAFTLNSDTIPKIFSLSVNRKIVFSGSRFFACWKNQSLNIDSEKFSEIKVFSSFDCLSFTEMGFFSFSFVSVEPPPQLKHNGNKHSKIMIIYSFINRFCYQ